MTAQIKAAYHMSWPADWAAVFGRPGPLLVEIGFGNGQFLVQLAHDNPEANVLGIERSWRSISNGIRRVNHQRLENVIIVHGGAQLALWALCQPKSITEVHINFPDPWPKKRHHSRRLINDPFLELLASRTVEKARLNIATDDRAYAAWIHETLSQESYFVTRDSAAFTVDSSVRSPTKYEQKAKVEERSCYYFRWQRTDKPAKNQYPPPEEYSMPHVEIHLPMAANTLISRLRISEVKSGETSVRFIKKFVTPDGRMILLDTYVQEAPFDQRLMLAISDRGNNKFLVHVYDTGYPRPTAGVHLAVGHLAKAAVDLDPNGRVVRENLTPSLGSKEQWLID